MPSEQSIIGVRTDMAYTRKTHILEGIRLQPNAQFSDSRGKV